MATKSKKKKARSDNDSAWKRMVEVYFPNFMEFFFPDIYADIDWAQPYKFLDTELRKLKSDSDSPKRLADKLVQLHLKDGEISWFLIHLEIQSYADVDFARRMFIYYYRIVDKFNEDNVVSLAVLTHPVTDDTPLVYEKKKWGFHHLFEFPVVKVWEYGQQIVEVEASHNPIALIVQAHLKVLEHKNNIKALTYSKVALVRAMYEKGFTREDVVKLYELLDWLVYLPEKWDKLYIEEVKEIEGGNPMSYVTSAEKMGIKQGLKQGAASLAVKQLQKRFGTLEPEIEQKIETLSQRRLDALGLALLDFSSKEDLADWLANLSKPKAKVASPDN